MNRNHDWVEVGFNLSMPSSLHIDMALPHGPGDVRTWRCARCGFAMDTNLQPADYRKAPADCDVEVVKQILED